MPKSKLQAVVEETSTQNAPSVTTAVKSIANVLLGPRGKTPIDNIIQMQHYQLWGFILIVVGLFYIVWLMQKKLDGIDKQYKEQFVLLHRLFKSHQDLQVEVRKKPKTVTPTTTPSPPTQNLNPSVAVQSVSVPPTSAAPASVVVAEEEVSQPLLQDKQQVSLEMEDEDELVFDEESSSAEPQHVVEPDYEEFE